MRYTLKKSEILRGKKIFQEVFERGRKCDCKYLRCFYIVDTLSGNFSSSTVAAGFAVSRQFKRAVDRNRIKRLMRESYRIHKQIIIDRCHEQKVCLQAVFLYAPASVDAVRLPSFSQIDADVLEAFATMKLTVMQ